MALSAAAPAIATATLTSTTGIWCEPSPRVAARCDACRRKTEGTAANATSSRSHAVFQVYVKRRAAHKSSSRISKLSLVDLAGRSLEISDG